jgi:ribose transport system ATP-binding protein
VKVLAGINQKDEGEIILNGRIVEITSPKHAQDLGISMIHQELNLVQTMSVAENIYLGREPLSLKAAGKISWKQLYMRAQKILDELHIDIKPKTILKNLGIAQQQMVELAKALSFDTDIIIMDEPTAVLTNKEIKTLFEVIKKVTQKGVSIVYISHRLEEFAELGDRVTVLRDGRAIKTLDIAKTNTNELIKLMVGRELKDMFPKDSIPIGEEVLRVENLNRDGVIKDISFGLRRGEILGVAGLVGSGRTEVARAVFGADKADSGRIYVDGKNMKIKNPGDAIAAGIGFVTEDRKKQGLVLQMSISKNVSLSMLQRFIKLGKIDLKKEEKTTCEYIDKLRIKTPGAKAIVRNLSGGNQQKVVLAKWLLSQSKIFIFDEPTRGIDVGAKVEVYNLMNTLLHNGASIIMISSELPEILGMSDRVMVMCRGEIRAVMDIAEADQEKILFYATGGGKYNA